MDRVVFQGNDGAPQAAAGGDSVASFQLIQHALPFFLAALLGQNQQEIENSENEDDRSNSEPSHTAANLNCQ
jgi:hypothetical protein